MPWDCRTCGHRIDPIGENDYAGSIVDHLMTHFEPTPIAAYAMTDLGVALYQRSLR